MASGNISADSGFARPRPRAKSCALTRARHPPQTATCAYARYPRARLARGHARVPARWGRQWWPTGRRWHPARPGRCCGGGDGGLWNQHSSSRCPGDVWAARAFLARPSELRRARRRAILRPHATPAIVRRSAMPSAEMQRAAGERARGDGATELHPRAPRRPGLQIRELLEPVGRRTTGGWRRSAGGGGGGEPTGRRTTGEEG